MLKTRRICHPDGRSEVVPVVLVQADARFAANELLSRETLGLATGRGGWFEEISKTRNSIYVAELRFNSETIRNGGHAHVIAALRMVSLFNRSSATYMEFRLN